MARVLKRRVERIWITKTSMWSWGTGRGLWSRRPLLSSSLTKPWRKSTFFQGPSRSREKSRHKNTIKAYKKYRSLKSTTPITSKEIRRGKRQVPGASATKKIISILSPARLSWPATNRTTPTRNQLWISPTALPLPLRPKYTKKRIYHIDMLALRSFKPILTKWHVNFFRSGIRCIEIRTKYITI